MKSSSKKKIIAGLLGVAAVFGSATVLAGWTWTSSYYTIDHLDATPTGGYRVWAAGLPQVYCSRNEYVMPYPGTTPEAQAEMNKMLLSAMLAGKKVRIRLESTCSSDRQTYREIRLTRTY